MYAEESAIFELISVRRPEFTEASINATWHALATAEVNAYIVRSGVIIPATDANSFLLLAEVCFYFEIAAQHRQLKPVIGQVHEERVGNQKTQWAKIMPMFFFAQGNAEGFYNLLPAETHRMRAMKLLESYISHYTNVLYGSPFSFSSVKQDTTSRGVGWDNEITDGWSY